jgi:dolichol-phosphate mannosyltransferase
MKLSIIIPARDEEENIEETVGNLLPVINPADTEIVVVNDHSKDNTEGVVKRMEKEHSSVRLVNNLKPAGFASALKTGFESASGEFVIPFMADSCDNPETLPLMFEKASKGCDLVCGSRYVRGGRRIGGPFVQGLFSMFVGVTLHTLTGIQTRDVGNAFKMYRRKILLSFDLKEKGFAVSMEACVNFFLSGYKICEVPTIWYGRKKGVSKFRLSKTLPYVRLYLYTIWKRWTSQ